MAVSAMPSTKRARNAGPSLSVSGLLLADVIRIPGRRALDDPDFNCSARRRGRIPRRRAVPRHFRLLPFLPLPVRLIDLVPASLTIVAVADRVPVALGEKA